ncbi:PIN domain-containing protein [Bosea sp. (in: a-proteobacteria)]|uniref:PIN domain-containing protein n=1 Tax=Bosea sp. (in: a-proteobacteria) TaxID=1871050 RepID=UPI002B461FD7|nr:PIN domain-containing protein [Bosea sp. (in: a-proteobacteria)]WRH59922.1 MAG: PIN domain-containing protein [Bosea sp. (in: a-proteobacteria)]
MYLLDTDMLSASAPTKAQQHDTWLEWQARAKGRLFLSAITIAEVEGGICACLRRGATAKALRLRQWIDMMAHLYDGRILPFDLNVANAAGPLLDRARAHGTGFADIAIAATAAAHGLIVLTGNERHFRPLEVACINPLRELPPL